MLSFICFARNFAISVRIHFLISTLLNVDSYVIMNQKMIMVCLDYFWMHVCIFIVLSSWLNKLSSNIYILTKVWSPARSWENSVLMEILSWRYSFIWILPFKRLYVTLNRNVVTCLYQHLAGCCQRSNFRSHHTCRNWSYKWWWIFDFTLGWDPWQKRVS